MIIPLHLLQPEIHKRIRVERALFLRCIFSLSLSLTLSLSLSWRIILSGIPQIGIGAQAEDTSCAEPEAGVRARG